MAFMRRLPVQPYDVMLILERTDAPAQHVPSGLEVLPSIPVLLTLEQRDVIALEPTTMKIKMITPSSASTVSSYFLDLPASVD